MAEKLESLLLYTLKDLAKLLEVTERTLHTYVKDGKLKAVKIGGKWKVTQDNLQKFINGE